jgi:hypothetical protein
MLRNSPQSFDFGVGDAADMLRPSVAKLTNPLTQRVLLECEIFRMPAGAKPVAIFRVRARFTPNYDVENVFILRTVTGWTVDPVHINNSRRDSFYFCGPNATNPKCPPKN